MKATDQQKDFEFLCHVKSDRVQSEQIKILHKKSGIECVIQFTSEKQKLRYSKQSQIILDYMSLHPMCKNISPIFIMITDEIFLTHYVYYN